MITAKEISEVIDKAIIDYEREGIVTRLELNNIEEMKIIVKALNSYDEKEFTLNDAKDRLADLYYSNLSLEDRDAIQVGIDSINMRIKEEDPLPF